MRAKFKSGAASFYVVAFSTLILVIIAASFATAIVSEITRTANDDLSQSAYDAALAGVEDAKLAFMNYQNCVKNGVVTANSLSGGADITCQDIAYWMTHPDCDMVAHILGRIDKTGEGGEVLVEETDDASNEMGQAYTCAMIQTNLDDYRANLSSSDPYKVVDVDLNGVSANDIQSIRVSWFSNPENSGLNYDNLVKPRNKDWTVAFRPTNESVATPPTIAVQLLQTAESFTLADINSASNGAVTDRAMVYLVPTSDLDTASKNTESYRGIGGSGNVLTATQVADTNNRSKNLPYVVYCPSDASTEYVCSAVLNLPTPVNGSRNDDTFTLIVSLPYGQPDTDFSLEFLCANGALCGRGEVEEGTQNSAKLNGVQVLIDSTGRANDLYRRVEVRLESASDAFSAPFYGIQALGNGGPDSVSIDKDKTVTTEWGL